MLLLFEVSLISTDFDPFVGLKKTVELLSVKMTEIDEWLSCVWVM